MKRIAVMPMVLISMFAIFAVTLRAKPKAAGSPVVGTWKCVAHGGPNGEIPFTLYLQQSGESLTGTISAPQGDADLTSVIFKNNRIKITIDTDEHNYTLTATLADGKLTGEWSRDGQKEGTWEGKK